MRRLLIAATLFTATAQAQFTMQNSGTTASLRGITNVNGKVAWASGTGGTVLRTVDDGTTWTHCATPPDADKLDFRGVQAFDDKTALVMSSGKGDLSRIYKTTDGCATWKLVFTNPDAPDGFFDAMQVDAHRRLWLLGDPVSGRFALRVSVDKGERWQPVKQAGLAQQEGGAGAFAASNSLILGGLPLYFATAGGWLYEGDSNCTMTLAQEHFDRCLPLFDFQSYRLPMAYGTSAAGIFAIAESGLNAVAVGGDYQHADVREGTAAFHPGPGRQWTASQTLPGGYRSSVVYDSVTKTWITTGPTGTDISTDDGRNWKPLTPETAKGDTPDADKNWNALSLPFVVGSKGRIGRLRADALRAPATSAAKRR